MAGISWVDVCRFTPTLGGTTDWTYSTAVTGYQSPSAAGVVNGTIYRYRAESADLSQWEIGYGAYNTGTGVLSRTTVLFNSAGTTAKINFSTVPQVALVALAEDLKPLATKPIFCFDGDSETNTSNLGLWPLDLVANFAFFNRGETHYFGTDGDTASNLVTEYSSHAGSVSIVPGQESYFFIWAGSNDLGASVAAATIYANLKSLWASGRASGYKVCAFTVMHRLDGATIDAQRVALNALIRSDTTLYDYLVEPDLYFVDTAEATIFLQGASAGHLTAAANVFLAKKVAAAILGVQAIPAVPFDALSSGIEINGAMEIDQLYEGAPVTGITTGNTTKYIVDGYAVANSGTNVVTAQRVADAPPGFTNSLKISVTTAESSLGAGSFCWIRAAIEGFRTSKLAFGTLNAAPITLGFFTKIHRPGTYTGVIINASTTRSFPISFIQNVADVWEFKTIQIPGDVAGTWIGNTNGVGLYLFMVMAAGSTFTASPANAWTTSSNALAATGQTNGVAATSDVFQITGLKILPGWHTLISEGMRRISRSTDVELALCQRQFRKSFPQGTAVAQNAGVAGAVSIKNPIALGDPAEWVPFSPTMRAAPTITTFNPSAANANWRDITAASDVTVSVDPGSTLSDSGVLLATSGTVASLGDILAIHYTANARL